MRGSVGVDGRASARIARGGAKRWMRGRTFARVDASSVERGRARGGRGDSRTRASGRDDVEDALDAEFDEDDALAVMNFDDDCVTLDEAGERDAGARAWLRVAERATTIGAIGSGIASVVTSEVAFGALAGTLPLVGALARRARERRALRARAAIRAARREEVAALRAKAARNVTIEEATARVAPIAAAAVRTDVAPILQELANRLLSVERAQIEAAKTAAKTARDSGAVAGMLARDLAAARVDAREGIASVREEFRTTAESATVELKKELTMLWELVENVEKDAASLREPMEALAEEIRDIVDGVVREVGANVATVSSSAASVSMSEEQLAELRAQVAEASTVKVREAVREAVERALESSPIAVSDRAAAQQLAATLDESQWEAMIERLSAIEANVSEARDAVVVEEDLEDLRVEITREISADIRGIVDSVAELKFAFEASKTNRGEGSVEAAAAVKQWAENKLKAATPSAEVREQIEWQAAIIRDEEKTEEKLIWVGEKTTTQEEPKRKTLNANTSRDEAFANMQALLNSKPSPKPENQASAATSQQVAAESPSDDSDEIWDPFLRAADAENVARYEAKLKAAETTDAAAQDAASDEFAFYSAQGLEALRSGRDLARRGGEDVDMLEDADEMFAKAIKDFERASLAATREQLSRADGNLGNAFLARGRVQAVLAEMAFKEAQMARDRRVNAGLEGTGEMYFELSEENLIQAGRRFRAVVSAESESGVVSDENKSGIQAKAKALAGWGSALSLRSELVLSTQGATADAESLAVAAAEKFRAAAEIEPDSPKIYVSWGDVLRLSASLGPMSEEEERLQQARGCYNEALRLAPEYGPALAALEIMQRNDD